jgi:hypothetical protein
MSNVFKFFKGLQAFLSSEERQTRLFWYMLKNHLTESELVFGTYEREKTLQVDLEVAENTTLKFEYIVHRSRFFLVCRFLKYEAPEDASEIFILAQHMNNLIGHDGTLRIETDDQICSLVFNVDFRPILFGYSGIRELILRHHSITVDARNAFLRLMLEGEEPAIIIADLMREESENEDDADKN